MTPDSRNLVSILGFGVDSTPAGLLLEKALVFFLLTFSRSIIFEFQGKVDIELQLVTADEATARPVGLGREPPEALSDPQ